MPGRAASVRRGGEGAPPHAQLPLPPAAGARQARHQACHHYPSSCSCLSIVDSWWWSVGCWGRHARALLLWELLQHAARLGTPACNEGGGGIVEPAGQPCKCCPMTLARRSAATGKPLGPPRPSAGRVPAAARRRPSAPGTQPTPTAGLRSPPQPICAAFGRHGSLTRPPCSSGTRPGVGGGGAGRPGRPAAVVPTG